MKIDLYHLYRGVHFSKLAYPIALDVLRVWAESKGWKAHVSICKEAQVDLATDADVVGISVYSQTAPAAYRVSEMLQRRGKVVILGGPHFRGPTTQAEAARYCDVIVSSICEEQMGNLLDLIEDGRLGPGRRPPVVISDGENRFRYPDNFYQSLRSRRWYQIPTIPTSVGCPYDCDFCAAYMQGKYRLREVDTVVSEMAYAPGSLALICDATFGLHKKFTIDLMRAMAPLKKKIGVETTLARLKDQEVLGAMAAGGVKWLVVGIETLTSKLRKHGSSELESSLKDVLRRVHDLGMMMQGNFICGMDCDGPDSFEQIYEFYDGSGLDGIMMGILTPYPDTALFRQLNGEGRIFDTNWEHYDCHHVVYRPRNMTVDELIEGYIWLYREVRKRRSLFREVVEGIWKHGPGIEASVLIANNLYQKFDSIKKAQLLRKNQLEIAQSGLLAERAEQARLHVA
ncbi:MAG TPA: radical SAM protein [Myxococcota bacterium]|nr:radical SAM protein [Myxococcota bacterium]